MGINNITSDYHNENIRTKIIRATREKNEKQRHIYMSRKYKDVIEKIE
jgi:UDP-glucose 6-dehydrogenase